MELKKKKVCIFFKCFPLLEKKKRKKKFVGSEPFLDYCPNNIVKKKIVLQEYDCIVTARRCS